MKADALNIVIGKIISEYADRYSHADLSAAYQQLQIAYAELKNANVKKKRVPLLKSDADYLAYILTRMPATCAVAMRVFREFFSINYPEKIQTMLDLGSGTGSLLWAASVNNVMGDLTKITAFDQDPNMIAWSQRLAAEKSESVWKNINWQEGNLTEKIAAPIHDLVTLSYVLVEHEREQQTKIWEQAWGLARHAIIIIEPGTPTGFANCLAARDFFIKQGGFIAAPCSHHGICPMKGEDWCHFSERIERSFWQKSFKKGSLGYEDEAYSYFIATKLPIVRPGSRILKIPAKKSSHVLLELCEPNVVKKVTVSKKQGNLFKAAKKARWGETISI